MTCQICEDPPSSVRECKVQIVGRTLSRQMSFLLPLTVGREVTSSLVWSRIYFRYYLLLC